MSEATVDSMMGVLQHLKDVRPSTFHFWAMEALTDCHTLTSGWLSVAVSSSCKRSDPNKPIRLQLLPRNSQAVLVIGSE
jgi:hypothetical protein